MNEDNGMQVVTLDGVTEIHEVKAEISTSDEEPYMEIRGGEGFSGSIELKLTRKDKKLWGKKVLMMPKNEVTEWANPRKKKRGAMRRARRRRRNAQATANQI